MPKAKSDEAFWHVLKAAPPELKAVCAELRGLVARLHGDFVEVVWPRQQIASFGVGPRKMSEHYAYIGVHRSHVNLGFYHGTSLPDPKVLLEGTGKKLRHVKIPDLRSARAPAVAALLRAAIADRRRHSAPA
jgi:hypothetical protein